MSPFDPATIPSSGDSFPATWTVDETTGAFIITMLQDAGVVTINQFAGALTAGITVKDGDGHTYFRVQPTGVTLGGTAALPSNIGIQTTGIKLWGDVNGDSNFVLHVKAGDKLGFFGTAPVVKPNVGAVPTALSIAAALVALGLVDSS